MPTPQIEYVEDVEEILNEGEEENAEDLQKTINEEYKTWKKNSPFLYDMILGTALKWPTLTVQWFPDVRDLPENNYTLHRLLLGTNTSGRSTEYLQIAEVRIPKPSKPDADDFDDSRGEIGGYGSKPANGAGAVRFDITQRIPHPGEINKARYQPQNPDVIASLNTDGRILVFDRTKHPLQPRGAGEVDFQLELVGHQKEGFGLCWSPHEQGMLASGSEDNVVMLWDLKDVQPGSKTVKPLRKYTHHSLVVNDVQYHPVVHSFIGTVSDDLTFQLIDTRQESTSRAALVAKNGHHDAINGLAFNPFEDVLVATASADKTVAVWDLRKVDAKLHTLDGHNDAVTAVSWHPSVDGVLASTSYDRRVILWDLSRVGEEQIPEDQDEGVPELLFMHGGHINHLSDFSWNLNDPWLCCSTGEDNFLQIWKPSESIVSVDDSVTMRMDELDR